jgi:hypothetical protein
MAGTRVRLLPARHGETVLNAFNVEGRGRRTTDAT